MIKTIAFSFNFISHVFLKLILMCFSTTLCRLFVFSPFIVSQVEVNSMEKKEFQQSIVSLLLPTNRFLNIQIRDWRQILGSDSSSGGLMSNWQQ